MKIAFLNVISYIVIILFLNGCGSQQSVTKPPVNFDEMALIGMWEAVSQVNSTQTLAIRADHTFSQYYSIYPGTPPIEVQGTWKMEPRPSGCVYLYFKGMRYIYLTEDTITNGNREVDGSLIKFREFCEGTRITMPDKVILSVGNNPKAPRDIELRFPCGAEDCLDNVMQLLPSVNP